MKYVLILAVAVLVGIFGYRLVGNRPSGKTGPGSTAKTAPGRLTLLNFTGSDQFWCQKLDHEVFSQPEFQQFARENLIFTKVDFPKDLPQAPLERAQNAELAKKYAVKGFPTIVVLNSKGREVGRLGYMPGGPKPFIEALKRLQNQ